MKQGIGQGVMRGGPLNKGQAHHALKHGISFHRRGEIGDRLWEGPHYDRPHGAI